MRQFYIAVGVIFLLMLFTGTLMSVSGASKKSSPTGMAVRPIQDVAKDLEDMGFVRVANEPSMRYAP